MGLADRGYRVTVVASRGRKQRPMEVVDGVVVYSYPLLAYPLTGKMYRRCNSDIYHSQDLSWGSIIALENMSEKIHLVTCQNPKSIQDWHKVNSYYPIRRRIFNKIFWDKLRRTIQEMDGVYCQAWYTIPKAKSIYELEEFPGFLPNPVRIPDNPPEKAETPTVCFLGRLDEEKRPELFFELAREFPEINFIAVGRAHNATRDERLRRRYMGIPNLELSGFKTGIEKTRILEDSWALVNTSISECLPISFLEAAAQGCAILSIHDPDDFATRFGYKASSIDDLALGLSELIREGSWREKGRKGYKYVKKVHDMRHVIDRHIEVYDRYLNQHR